MIWGERVRGRRLWVIWVGSIIITRVVVWNGVTPPWWLWGRHSRVAWVGWIGRRISGWISRLLLLWVDRISDGLNVNSGRPLGFPLIPPVLVRLVPSRIVCFYKSVYNKCFFITTFISQLVTIYEYFCSVRLSIVWNGIIKIYKCLFVLCQFI